MGWEPTDPFRITWLDRSQEPLAGAAQVWPLRADDAMPEDLDQMQMHRCPLRVEGESELSLPGVQEAVQHRALDAADRGDHAVLEDAEHNNEALPVLQHLQVPIVREVLVAQRRRPSAEDAAGLVRVVVEDTNETVDGKYKDSCKR